MKETRLVRIALFLILVAFSLIYALFFMVQWEHLRKDFQSIFVYRWFIESGNIQKTPLSTGLLLSWNVVDQNTSDATTSLSTESSIVSETPDSFITDVLSATNSGQRILSWTALYYGSLDILKTLWIRYEHILKDKNYNIYYVYIGKKWSTYNIPEIVKAIWWTTIEIYAKNAIIDNLYFGDRVTFATLPSQLSIQTNVFVRIDDELWLIQDLTGEYKQNKKHIRYIFTNQ